MPVDSSFTQLMTRLRAGDEEAASQVFHRFARPLLTLTRRRLNRRLRQKIDPEDVLQSVFCNFFVRQADGGYQLESWDSLRSMLMLMTVRKCSQRAEYFHSARRNVRREVAAALVEDDTAPAWQASAHEPTPDEQVILDELAADLMADLDANERAILRLSLQAHSVAEISRMIQRTERTVQRVLRGIRQRLQEMCVGDREEV